MAILLALKGGKRTKFGLSCTISQEADGSLKFTTLEPDSKSFRIIDNGGRWVVDARKCTTPVKLGSAEINAAPRSLPPRAVLALGNQKMLFVAKDDDLEAAVTQLKERLAKVTNPKPAAPASAGDAGKPKLPEINKPKTSGPISMPGAKSASPVVASAPGSPLRTVEDEDVQLDPAVLAGLVEVIEDDDVTLSPMDLAGLK